MAAVSSDSAVAAEETSASATAAQPVTPNTRVSVVVIPIFLAVEVGWLAVLGYVLWSLT